MNEFRCVQIKWWCKMILRKLLIFPPILLGIGIIWFLLASKKPPEQKTIKERVRYVRVIEATRNDFTPKAIGYGIVKPGRVWNAVSQVSGQIEYVNPDFKKGATLTKGTEIIRISDQDYRLEIRQAEANLRSAEAQLKELSVTEQNNQNALKIEQKALSIKKQELSRQQKLLQKGTLAQATIDQEQRDLLSQEKRVVDLQNSIKLIPTQIQKQKEQIEIYKTQLETAKLNLDRTKIRLPFSGRVSQANVEVTQYVGVGTTLGAIDGIQIAEIEAQFPQTALQNVFRAYSKYEQPVSVVRGTFRDLVKQVGLNAIVRLKTGLNKVEWGAKVVRISDTINPKTRAVGVIVNVKDHYKNVIPGRRPPLVKEMFVEVELRTAKLEKQFIVPRSAVHDNHLYIVNKENRLEKKSVEVALVQDDFALISNGIKAGQKIVVSDLSPAIENMLLETTIDEDLTKQLSQKSIFEGAAK